ncbi:MAG: hypothetical protein K2F95_06155 [Alistipes sp.]|nr:hypothetical protein [Alistipes sp.]MDE7129246.1 hypothetical protein [Alistipes sp.]
MSNEVRHLGETERQNVKDQWKSSRTDFSPKLEMTNPVTPREGMPDRGSLVAEGMAWHVGLANHNRDSHVAVYDCSSE